ncbi:MAG: flagellar hook-length control protein FliK, partial [Vicinamibacterales bacterium]
RVSATLVVERSDVRAQIEGQGAALRAGLAAQGLTLEEFVVREDGERRKGSGQDAEGEQSGRRRRQASDKSFDLDDA